MRTRVLMLMAGVLACLLAASPAKAQGWIKPEIRPFGGAYVPVGDMRKVLDDAPMVGVQAAVEIQERVHGVASVGWAFSHDKNDANVHVSQYDVGLEVFQSFDLTDSWMLRPFLGAGAGGRTYIFDGTSKDSQNDLAGYGTLGVELQTDRTALRLAGRGYLTRFEGLSGVEDKVTRGDFALSAGLAYHLK